MLASRLSLALALPRLYLPVSRLLACGLLAFGVNHSAHAIALMDIEPGDIVPMVAQLKEDLHLTPNQQILWQQTLQRTRALVRQRQARREQLQAQTALQLSKPDMEFSDLANAVAQETKLSEDENRQLRELWLTVADALDDKQRVIAQNFIADMMQRVTESRQSSSSNSGKDHKGGGMGGGGMGGGGMGGSGMGGGGIGGSGSAGSF